MDMDKERQYCVEETLKHRDKVKEFLEKFSTELNSRGLSHDASKLSDIEIDGFIQYTPKLRECTYGSDEYMEYLEKLKPSLEHHYRKNSHHAEHFPEALEDYCTSCGHGFNDLAKEYMKVYHKCPNCGIVGTEVKQRYTLKGMNLADVVEMLCDWKAASLRHNNGDLEKSIEINRKRFGISDDLFCILKNTVRDLIDRTVLEPTIEKKEATTENKESTEEQKNI
jgi:predicted RNA-binding Zn-ribbon protein involved in translation (DUF1610 family)